MRCPHVVSQTVCGITMDASSFGSQLAEAFKTRDRMAVDSSTAFLCLCLSAFVSVLVSMASVSAPARSDCLFPGCPGGSEAVQLIDAVLKFDMKRLAVILGHTPKAEKDDKL
jgi:hypothetical protein